MSLRGLYAITDSQLLAGKLLPYVEAALDGGRLLPACATALRSGASLFDDVAYGSVPAGPESDRALRDLDDSVRAARPPLVSR